MKPLCQIFLKQADMDKDDLLYLIPHQCFLVFSSSTTSIVTLPPCPFCYFPKCHSFIYPRNPYFAMNQKYCIKPCFHMPKANGLQP